MVLALGVVTVVLAVPGLRPVASEVSAMSPVLVAAAAALELASCFSFVVIFRMFFPQVQKQAARELAWSQMGSGALLPGGGVGSLAVGGWLLHLVGIPTREIVQRSSGLFFLTSALNVLALGVASTLLLVGVGSGPHDVLRTGLPVVAVVSATILALGLPRFTRHVSRSHPRMAWLEDISIGIPAARAALARPSWRLLGGFGYLLFDIAVLWTVFVAVGTTPPLAPLVVAYLVGYLANAVPIPGGVGVLDAGLVGALALYGLPVTHAVAAVLVYHAVAFWIPTLGGTLAYGRLRPHLTLADGGVGSESSPPQLPAVNRPAASSSLPRTLRPRARRDRGGQRASTRAYNGNARKLAFRAWISDRGGYARFVRGGGLGAEDSYRDVVEPDSGQGLARGG